MGNHKQNCGVLYRVPDEMIRGVVKVNELECRRRGGKQFG